MLESPWMLRYSLYDEGRVRECDPSDSYSSDKSSAADNQQERLIKIGWIVGFVDGEGCFSIHVVRQPERANRKGYKTGFHVAHQFVVTQGAKSVECLQMMQQYFGVGRLHCNRRYDNHKEHLYQFVVGRRDAHLTRRGLLEILEIMQTMNHCKPRTEMIRILRDYMPNADLFVGEDIVRSAWRHAG